MGCTGRTCAPDTGGVVATIVSDTFTAAADEDLVGHVPDTGNAWVQQSVTGTANLRVIAATDVCSPAANVTAGGQTCKSQPDPTVAEYDVSIKLAAVDSTTNNRPVRIHARLTATDTYYACRINPTARTQNSGVELIRSNAGTVTILASNDRTHAVNDVYLLEIRDATKRVLVNGAELLSSSDNTLTSAGSACLSMGFVHTNDDGNAHTAWDVDDYSVVTVDASAPAQLFMQWLNPLVRM